MTSPETTSKKLGQRSIVPGGTEIELPIEMSRFLPVRFVKPFEGDAPYSRAFEKQSSIKVRQTSSGEVFFIPATTIKSFVEFASLREEGPSLGARTEDLELADREAMRVYKEAFSEIFGKELKFKIESVQSPSHSYFRLIVTLPRKLFAKFEEVISQEVEVLRLIDQKASAALGYFSIQYSCGK